MVKSIDFKKRKNEDVTTMKVNIWFLKLLQKYRKGREDWQDIAIRLITRKSLSSDEKAELKKEARNFQSFL